MFKPAAGKAVIMLADSDDGVAFVGCNRDCSRSPGSTEARTARCSTSTTSGSPRIDDELYGPCFAADTDRRLSSGWRAHARWRSAGAGRSWRRRLAQRRAVPGEDRRPLPCDSSVPIGRLLEIGVSASGDEIWLAESDDLACWRPVGAGHGGRPHYWDELIGSGPPAGQDA